MTGVFLMIFQSLVVKKDKKIINIILFCLPIVTVLFLIYFGVLRNQNQDLVVPILNNNILIRRENIKYILLNWEVMKVLFPGICLMSLYLIALFNKNIRKFLKPFNEFILFLGLLTIVFLFVAIIFNHPIAVNYKWSMSLNVIFTLSWLPLLLVCEKLWCWYFKNKYKYLKMGVIIFLVVFLDSRTMLLNILSKENFYINYVNNNIGNNDRLLINAAVFSVAKYHFEYGGLRAGKYGIYLNMDTFNDGFILPVSIKNFEKINDYDYIMTGFMEYEGSELQKVILNNQNWRELSQGDGMSRIFKNMTSKRD